MSVEANFLNFMAAKLVVVMAIGDGYLRWLLEMTMQHVPSNCFGSR